jgi:hypothetical protein
MNEPSRPDDQEPRRCLDCGGPIRLNAARVKRFEGLHAVCFHYRFEHDAAAPGDRDEDCGLDHCPAAGAAGRRNDV